MTTLTSILLLSLCYMSSTSVINVGLQSVNSTDDSPSSQELIIQSENTADDSPDIQELIIQSENTTDDSPDIQAFYSGACPENWELNDQRCFRFISTARTWAEAERFCLLLGGNLASVHSVAEYHFIQGLIVAHTHGTPATWIGGSDAQQEGIWFWSDASRFTFTLWAIGEPNNNQRPENCLSMNHGGNLGWNDYHCSTVLPSVCARRLAS